MPGPWKREAEDEMYLRYGKRLLDVVFAGIAVIVLGPIMAMVAVAIHLEDGGPAIFRQQRVGRFGKHFSFMKFRGMPVDTPDTPSAELGTPRLTRVGSIIRRTNIDELPQLFSILKGDMSLVGPRPAHPKQVELCSLREEAGASSSLPGLTGLAQINSYDGMPEAEVARWDEEYAKRTSLLLDMVIVARTFAYLTKRPPVY